MVFGWLYGFLLLQPLLMIDLETRMLEVFLGLNRRGTTNTIHGNMNGSKLRYLFVFSIISKENCLQGLLHDLLRQIYIIIIILQKVQNQNCNEVASQKEILLKPV